MPQTAIFGPLFAMFLLTFAVWVFMYVRRIRFLGASGVEAQQLAAPGELARISPAEVANPSDNLKNLFELPVLFYALALALFVTGGVDGIHLAAAWIFVAFRVLHSAVHCTVNVVMVRFYLYLVSAIALWFMAARAALRHLAA